MSGRRLVVHPDHAAYIAGYQRAVADLRGQMNADHYETLVEINILRRELADLRQLHARALEAVRAEQDHQRAHAEHRHRELTRAWSAERDLATPLN